VPVVLDSAGGEVRPLAEPLLDVNWASPRWSPDGGTIAVARWQAGGYLDIVLLDAETGRVTREITHDRAVDASPAWSPDGRYVVFSSDRSGIPNLYAFDLREGRLLQVSSVLTGAFQPDVSPDGRWIAFMLYAADGYHVARMPFDPGTFRGPAPLRDESRQAGAPAAESRRNAGGESHPYSPWRTLRPAAWEPFFDSETDLGTSLGAAVSGQDVTTRHAYGAYASVFVDGGRVEGGASYLYRGLGRPVIGASMLQDWDSFRLDENGGLLLERERSASLVATWPIPRFRSYRWVSVGVGTRDRDYSVENAADSLVPLIPAEVGGAVTVGMSTVRAYDYSISAERGWLAAVGAEGRRYVDRLGTEADPRGYLRLTGRGHAFHPLALGGFARHALALRVQGGAVTGDQPPPFYLGGLGSDAIAYPLSTFVTLGSSPDLSLRGYHGATQAGDRAVSASAEYRFPIALVEHGYRLLPLYLDRLSGTLWADAGAAWCVEICTQTGGRFPARPDPLYSVGGELGVRAGFFFVPPLDLRFGAGFPLRAAYDADGVRRTQNPQLYFLIGRSY
jgi:hypothetical protein